jgi:hypothetical protein
VRASNSGHAGFVHARERGGDGAGLREDGAKGRAGVGRVGDFAGEAREGVADELREVEIRRGAELLAVAKHAEEAHGIVEEDVGCFGGEFTAAHDETVDAFRALEAAGEQAFAEGQAGGRRVAPDAEGEAFLDEPRHAEDRLRGAVVVLHEVLDAREHLGLAVTEPLGDLGLEIEVHGVGRARAGEVELVAHAEEKIVGAAEGREVVGAHVVLVGEVGEGGVAEFHAGHPGGVLVVAQAADAVLDVGLLVKHRVARLGAPARLIVEARGDVGFRVLVEVVAAVGLGECVEELRGARDEARLEERGLGLDFLARLDEHLVDGARRVADLQPAVPERVEDFVGEVFLEGFREGGFRFRGKQEHHVDVAPRAEFAAPVAAERNDRHGRRQRPVRPRKRLRRVGEEPREQRVDDLRALVRDGEAGGARGVARAHVGGFVLEKLPARGRARGDRRLAGKHEPLVGVLLEQGGHETRRGTQIAAAREGDFFPRRDDAGFRGAVSI